MNRWIIPVLILISFDVSGQGFRINNQGVKATGMGGYATAVARDASAVFYNPAAISRLDQSMVTAGFNVALPQTSYLDPYDGNVDMDPSVCFPFNIYGVTKLKGKISAGVGIFTPFSEHTEWEENWAGRYITIKNRFRSLYIQPVISYAFNEKFSIGAGPVLGWAGMDKTMAVDVSSASSPYGIAELKGAAAGFGFTVGLHAQLDNLSIGVCYRSQVKLKMENGDAVYSNISPGANLLEGIPSSASFNTELSTPAAIDAGLSFKLNEKLEVAVNTSYTMWSVNEEVVYNFDENPQLNFTELPMHEDAISISAGGNYHYVEKIWFRAGIGITKSHVPGQYLSPAHPDADQFNYCGGMTWQWKPELSLDFSVMVRDYKTRKESNNIPYNFNGEYSTTLYIGGVGVNYTF